MIEVHSLPALSRSGSVWSLPIPEERAAALGRTAEQEHRVPRLAFLLRFCGVDRPNSRRPTHRSRQDPEAVARP